MQTSPTEELHELAFMKRFIFSCRRTGRACFLVQSNLTLQEGIPHPHTISPPLPWHIMQRMSAKHILHPSSRPLLLHQVDNRSLSTFHRRQQQLLQVQQAQHAEENVGLCEREERDDQEKRNKSKDHAGKTSPLATTREPRKLPN